MSQKEKILRNPRATLLKFKNAGEHKSLSEYQMMKLKSSRYRALSVMKCVEKRKKPNFVEIFEQKCRS